MPCGSPAERFWRGGRSAVLGRTPAPHSLSWLELPEPSPGRAVPRWCRARSDLRGQREPLSSEPWGCSSPSVSNRPQPHWCPTAQLNHLLTGCSLQLHSNVGF